MDALDPRHGTAAGYVAHTKANAQACLDCRRAKAGYERQRSYDNHLGRPRIVPSRGVQRRVRALQRLGWSLTAIAMDCGWKNPEDLHYALNNETCSRKTRERVVESYERLSMQIPPLTSGSARARKRAERLGYVPPLAWDDIDNDEEPAGWEYVEPRRENQYHRREVDPVVVMRLLQGDRVTSTPEERAAALDRWAADGGSLRELASWHGWKAERYTSLRAIKGGAA